MLKNKKNVKKVNDVMSLTLFHIRILQKTYTQEENWK